MTGYDWLGQDAQKDHSGAYRDLKMAINGFKSLGEALRWTGSNSIFSNIFKIFFTPLTSISTPLYPSLVACITPCWILALGNTFLTSGRCAAVVILFCQESDFVFFPTPDLSPS